MAKRTKKKAIKSHDIIIDAEIPINYRRKKKNKKRLYHKIIHRNNLNAKYCGLFGYYRNGEFIKLWIKSSEKFIDLKEELDSLSENHFDIVLGRIRIVKIKSSLLESGYYPVCDTGDPLPPRFKQSSFFVIKNNKKLDFGLSIRAKDGSKYQVPSECFVRTYPKNWFLI